MICVNGSQSQAAAAAEALRSTAKWLVTAFAAVGAALIAGLQLSGIGGLGSEDLLRLFFAVLGLAGGVLGVGYMIRETAGILTVEWVTLADLDDDTFEEILYHGGDKHVDEAKSHLFEVAKKISGVREELFAHAAPSVGELQSRLRGANKAAAEIIGQAPTQKVTAEDEAKAFGRSRELREAARAVVDYANYHRTLRLFNQLKPRLARGAVATVTSVAVFAYATNPPT